MANGFSHSTCLPAFNAAIDRSWCAPGGVMIATASMSSRSDQLERIGVNTRDARIGGSFLGLFPVAAADRRDIPAFRAKTRHVHLRAEPDAYDSDSAFR